MYHIPCSRILDISNKFYLFKNHVLISINSILPKLYEILTASIWSHILCSIILDNLNKFYLFGNRILLYQKFLNQPLSNLNSTNFSAHPMLQKLGYYIQILSVAKLCTYQQSLTQTLSNLNGINLVSHPMFHNFE